MRCVLWLLIIEDVLRVEGWGLHIATNQRKVVLVQMRTVFLQDVVFGLPVVKSSIAMPQFYLLVLIDLENQVFFLLWLDLEVWCFFLSLFRL